MYREDGYYEDSYDLADSTPCRYYPHITCYDCDCEGCAVLANDNGEDLDSEEWLPYDPYDWMI